jgi:hypothetical protein
MVGQVHSTAIVIALADLHNEPRPGRHFLHYRPFINDPRRRAALCALLGFGRGLRLTDNVVLLSYLRQKAGVKITSSVNSSSRPSNIAAVQIQV